MAVFFRYTNLFDSMDRAVDFKSGSLWFNSHKSFWLQENLIQLDKIKQWRVEGKPPQPVPNSFNSMQFSANILSSNRLHTRSGVSAPVCEILDPPLVKDQI